MAKTNRILHYKIIVSHPMWEIAFWLLPVALVCAISYCKIISSRPMGEIAFWLLPAALACAISYCKNMSSRPMQGTIFWLLPAALCTVSCGGSVERPPAGPPDGSIEAGVSDGAAVVAAAIGTTNAADCPSCTFPTATAPPCAAAPSIKIVYPPDTALLPPNLGMLSVQWVPFAASFVRFEVDFTQSAKAPFTDWRIVTACAAQTTDVQDAGSGGCELTVDPTSWAALAAANRGGEPVAVTVRGTTDGSCASTSEDTIHISLAQEDVLGTYFHWKSEPALLGQSGQVWAQTFGDVTDPETNVTSPLFEPLCSGCHSLSRDGSRMLVYPIDDTDPDYGGLSGNLVDMTPWPAAAPVPLAAGQPPGWTAISSTAASYLTSNGLPCQAADTKACPQAESATLPAPLPVSGISLWNGQNGAFSDSIQLGVAGARPTMPDWSVDGASVVYVVPATVGSWDNGARNDDDHIFGGSLYSVPYQGSGSFGAPALLVATQGENNYYPSYSPDAPASFILFDRAPLDMSVAALTGCLGTPPAAICPNDSFANPAARLMLMANAPGAVPVDLESANGSPITVRAQLSNSFPRFAPFVQTYHGKRLFWITFSSTRDYALRVLNHKDGMHPCYPADSYEWPGSVHRNLVDPLCQHPQLWMAPILEDAGGASASDPSGVAFWIPYQDPTVHNHMATWTWAPRPQSADGGSTSCACSTMGGPCGPANLGCGCCSGEGLVCSGASTCIQPIR